MDNDNIDAANRDNNAVPNSEGRYNEPQIGTDSRGENVTFQHGINSQEGHTLISDGVKSDADFKGSPGERGHDHVNENNDYTSERGEYTG